LRERRDDVALLVAHLLRKHTPQGQTPPELDERALHSLTSYSWPGNVRELENVIERALTLNRGGRITPEDLPSRVCGYGAESVAAKSGAPAIDDLAALFAGLPAIDEMERRYLLYVLDATGGNRKRAAEILGINRRTLYRMAERFQIEL
jgi:DNA-binding NtrC family response regulator